MSLMFSFIGQVSHTLHHKKIWLRRRMLILLCLCHRNENNASKASHPKVNVDSTLWPEWLSGVMGSTIHTELKGANMLTLGQFLLLMKGALMWCYAVQADSKSATHHMSLTWVLQVFMLVLTLYTNTACISLCCSHAIFDLFCMHTAGDLPSPS